MVISIIALVVGLMILAAGLYYLCKEKDDKESRKIYTITTLIGLVISVFGIVKMALCVL